MAALVPTFEVTTPHEFLKAVVNERPESLTLTKGKLFHFIFIVERADGMQSDETLEIAYETLRLFIKSLPKSCEFSIIGFGKKYESWKHNGQEVLINKKYTRG